MATRPEKNRIVVFDVETTGLPSYACYSGDAPMEHEILQLAMVDGDGVCLLNGQYRPARIRRWSEAQKVHGIAPKDVQGKPPIVDSLDRIQQIVDEAQLLVAYNVSFDRLFLQAVGISFSGKEFYDVMTSFAQRHGAMRRDGRGAYVSLQKCAAYYGYSLMPAHDAEADARATLSCYYSLLKE
jgi:DNA polymerase-3 subunit epsilon